MHRATSLFFFAIVGAGTALACTASTIDDAMATRPGAVPAVAPDGSEDTSDEPVDEDTDDAGTRPRRDAGSSTRDAGTDGGSRSDGGSRADSGALADAGRSDSGGGVGANCRTLSTCCSALPSTWQSACRNSASFNDETECQRLFGVYQGDGYCGGGPQGACTSLDACCQQLPSGSTSTCEYYVTANSQTDCATIHANYKSAGSCK